MVEKQSEAFHTWHSVVFFPSLKQNFIAYRSSKVSSRSDWIFEIHQLWQSDFSRVYSNCCCSCLFEPEMVKISQSSHKMYSNNILNFQESTTILSICTKIVLKLIECTTYKRQTFNCCGFKWLPSNFKPFATVIIQKKKTLTFSNYKVCLRSYKETERVSYVPRPDESSSILQRKTKF